MLRALIVILLIGLPSIYYSDFESESVLASLLLPILAVLSLIGLALWAVCFFHRRGISQTVKPGAGPGASFGDGGDGG